MIEKSELRARIEKFTQVIRMRLNLSSPLNMLNVVKSLNISCIPVENVIYDAMLSKNGNNDYCIYYDKNQIPERQQFSIAHELGHLLLHELSKKNSQEVYYRTIGKHSRLEWEANEFAASLLMPRDEFISFCVNNADTSGLIDLSNVANNFCVSKQAARVRGSVLGLWAN